MKTIFRSIYSQRKISLFYWLFICIFLTYSCKENKERVHSTPEKVNIKKQISYIRYGTDPNAVKWYKYDEKGDLVKQGMSADTIVFDYSETKIIKRHLDKKNSWLSRIEYTTNQNGRITGSISFDENDKEISKINYFYNAGGYLIKSIEFMVGKGSNFTNEYFYEAGNLKEVKTFTMKGDYNSSYVFDYYPEKMNTLNLCTQQISDDIFPNNRLGIKNINLVRQMSNISKEGDTLSLLKYSYADENNTKILREFQSDVLNEFDTEVTYHFSNKK